MKIGRNAPCPCGSGKKYKVCCLRLDRANRGVPGGAPIRAAATRAEVWQADIVPIPIAFEDQPGARPAAVMITADEFVIFTDILSRPSPEVEDLAAELESGFRAAVANVDASPKEIAVREPAVAVALAERLAGRGEVISVHAAPLPDLDRAAASLIQELGGPPGRIGACHPASWRAWNQPDEWIAQLFARCADYFRAEPWKLFEDFPPILAHTAEDRAWVLSVLGSAGVEYGLAFYSDPEDYRSVIEGQVTSYGRVLGLTFENAARLGRTMRKEVARAGWPVAAADAYPVLLTIGCPAGGLRAHDAEDLTRIVAAFTSWVEAIDRNPSLPNQGPWRDPATDVELEWVLRETAADIPAEILEPGDAQGSGAEPELRIAPKRLATPGPISREEDWLWRLREDLARDRLKPKTVRYHTENVYLFLDFLANWAGVPVRCIHEYDLRTFLFDWYPRKVAVSRSDASRVPASLRRFFKMLDRQADISCPWAFPILKDKETFLDRWDDSQGGVSWETDAIDWREEHFIDLELRAMTPSHEVPGVLTWGEIQGMNEAQLWDELQHRWLVWRDELIRSGIDQAEELVVTLRQTEAQWLTTTHPGYGETPAKVIEAERAERQEPTNAELAASANEP